MIGEMPDVSGQIFTCELETTILQRVYLDHQSIQQPLIPARGNVGILQIGTHKLLRNFGFTIWH